MALGLASQERDGATSLLLTLYQKEIRMLEEAFGGIFADGGLVKTGWEFVSF